MTEDRLERGWRDRAIRPVHHEQPMNVLQVISSSRTSGAEKHMVVLSDRLRSRGHEVVAVCPPGGWITRQLASARVPMIEWPMHGLGAPATILRLRSYVRAHNIEMIHTHLTRAAYMGYIAGLLARVPVVSSVHTLTRDWAYRYLPKHNHWFVTVSHHLRDTMIAQGLDNRRVRVVYNGTDETPLRGDHAAVGASVRCELGIPLDATVMGTFGRVDDNKGQSVVVQAARTILQDVESAWFLFVGDVRQAEKEKLLRIARGSGCVHRLVFTGVRDDVARLMAATDIAVHPSRTETFGMVIAEAMMIGIPVIATRAGGIPELIEHGVTGLLTERTPESVGAAIISLCKDPEKRAAMGAAARDRALRLFTADAMAANMEAFYRDILQSTSRSAA